MKSEEILQLAEHFYNKGNYQKAAVLYQKVLAENPTLFALGKGITLAHSLILSCNWDTISEYLPTHRNYLETSGWLNSLKLNKPVNQDLQPIPWYTYPAIEFIEDKIQSDFTVFEYGSGQSTLWWANRVSKLTSVESNEQWFNYLRQNVVKNENISLSLIENEQEYIAEIANYDDYSFNVIIIDGDSRSECAKQAYSKVKNNGFIIFDDTDRKEYNEVLLFLKEKGFYRLDFPGMTPSLMYKNCTSILFKNIDFLNTGVLPNKKKSCLGKSYFQDSYELSDYFKQLQSLSVLDEIEFSEKNYILFPDWLINEEELAKELANTFLNFAHKMKNQEVSLFIYIDKNNQEKIEELIADIIMSLMMEKNLEFSEHIKISLIPFLTQYQWKFLMPKITRKISFIYENTNSEIFNSIINKIESFKV